MFEKIFKNKQVLSTVDEDNMDYEELLDNELEEDYIQDPGYDGELK